MAALIRRFGVEHFAAIENAAQEAYVRALEHWQGAGELERWLVRTAGNFIIDELRARRRIDDLEAAAQRELEAVELERRVDDELCLVFLCCHPVLPSAARSALTLNVAFGLSARAIAVAFVSDERTIAQRIVRAKQRLRDEGVRFEIPAPSSLPERLASVLDVLYLLFGLGHELDEVDDSWCVEALRLARLLSEQEATASGSSFALRALFCFHQSRAAARRADDGSALLLHEQDRSRWDPALVREGFACLEGAARGELVSRFHLEAGIAACHAAAASVATTDWAQVVELYDGLREQSPSPIVEVNRAFAVAMLAGAHAGLDELDAIPERELIARYPYALATYAELYTSLGELERARSYLERALTWQSSASQRALLQRKLAALARR